MWERKRLLIWGTTYPEFSRKYYETVCTGAVDGATGRLIRIYPIRLRYLSDQKFRHFQWIQADVERRTKDRRPESHHIRDDTIEVAEVVDAARRGGWDERCRWVLGRENVFESVDALVEAEERDSTSLGLVRVKKVQRIYAVRRPDSERDEWHQHREEAIRQRDLLVDQDQVVKELEFRDVNYKVDFKCEAVGCRGHDMKVLDWGVYVLDRKQAKKKGDYRAAEEDVKDSLSRLLNVEARDPYVFLGNSLAHPQNFSVVGIFSPPRRRQQSLPL